MRSAASRDTDVTKQNNLSIKLQHSSAASLFRTSLEIGQNLHSTAKSRMMFAQLHQFKKLNSILYIIRNTLLKICILPAPPEVCYATPRGVATPSLGSPELQHGTNGCLIGGELPTSGKIRVFRWENKHLLKKQTPSCPEISLPRIKTFFS